MSRKKVKSSARKQRRTKRQQAQATKSFVSRATKADAHKQAHRSPTRVVEGAQTADRTWLPLAIYGRGITMPLSSNYEFVRIRLRVTQEGIARDALKEEARQVVEEYLAREEAILRQEQREVQPYPYLTGRNVRLELIGGLTLRHGNARTPTLGERTTDWLEIGAEELLQPGELVGTALERLTTWVETKLSEERRRNMTAKDV